MSEHVRNLNREMETITKKHKNSRGQKCNKDIKNSLDVLLNKNLFNDEKISELQNRK